LPNIPAVAPPPPPVRRTQPSLPAITAAPGEPLPIPAPPTDLALARTVVATGSDIVPPELQAAVLVPAASRAPSPIAEPAPIVMAALSTATPQESRVEPAAATSPYKATPVEETPAITTAALDVSGSAKSSRPKLRTGVVLAVTAAAVATGFGLTLLIGRAVGQAPSSAAAVKPTPRVATSAVATPAPAEPREPALKAAAIAKAPALEAGAAVIAGPTAESAPIPISTVTVPGCRELLGDGFVEKADPNAALTETQIGNRELVRGKVDASQAAFCKAALYDGAKVERWLNLAQIFLIRHDATKAVESSGRALELDPRSARALEFQGDAFARLGKLKEARLSYLAAEARPEPEAEALKWVVRRDLDEANRSLKSRDFVRAERLFRRVVVFDPGHAGAALGVATCLRKQNNQKAADEWERHAEMLVRSARR
jgi:hypothetical protein